MPPIRPPPIPTVLLAVLQSQLPPFPIRNLFLIQRQSLFSRSRARSSGRAIEHLNVHELAQKRRDYDRDRTYFLLAGTLAGVLGIAVTSYKLYKAVSAKRVSNQKTQTGDVAAPTKDGKGPKQLRLDSAAPSESYTIDGDSKRKVVVHGDDGRELVPSGNGTVPMFPRTIELPSYAPQVPTSTSTPPLALTLDDSVWTEYTLIGLGTRTVSFLGIQVYVVGFYVATADVAALQTFLVKKVNPIATTLVPAERDALRTLLLDHAAGEQTWEEALRGARCRSAFRIVPVRDTDMHHLRDGFVRAIAGRSQRDRERYADEEFVRAVGELKNMFNRGRVPKRQEMVLVRSEQGSLSVLYDDGQGRRQFIGEVGDERVSTLLWLNYLAGKNVASESARQSIVDGVMEVVERPVGTVASQVV